MSAFPVPIWMKKDRGRFGRRKGKEECGPDPEMEKALQRSQRFVHLIDKNEVHKGSKEGLRQMCCWKS